MERSHLMAGINTFARVVNQDLLEIRSDVSLNEQLR